MIACSQSPIKPSGGPQSDLTLAMPSDNLTPTNPPAEPTATVVTDGTRNSEKLIQLAESVTNFIATVSLEYGSFDRSLFTTLVNWLEPVAEELRVNAILVPNTVPDINMPVHDVVVLDTGEHYYLYTAAYNPNVGHGVIVCARPALGANSRGKHCLLHCTESVFKVSLATPSSPFLPEVPTWIRRAS